MDFVFLGGDMADKRYQVFVSSTYEDLKEERLEALTALLTAKCFVAGMEYFTAIDKDQFEYIKKIIDDCDFYLLILGGKYGSIPDGEEKSYTEKEFDYALAQGKKIIALLHKDPKSLPMNKCECTPDKIEKYERFRDKIKTGRLVDFWMDISELKAKIIAAIYQAKDSFPDLVGWVRGNTPSSEDMLELLQKNIKLEGELNALKNNIQQSDKIICLQELARIIPYSCGIKNVDIPPVGNSIIFSDIFIYMSKFFFNEINTFGALGELEKYLASLCNVNEGINTNFYFDPESTCDDIFDKFQLLNLIKTFRVKKTILGRENTYTCFAVTDFGRSILLALHSKNS
jgi:hypothetical protein